MKTTVALLALILVLGCASAFQAFAEDTSSSYTGSSISEKDLGFRAAFKPTQPLPDRDLDFSLFIVVGTVVVMTVLIYFLSKQKNGLLD